MASDEKPKTAPSKKFFDVSKPGKAMPPSTSRPAIIGHRTILKDPMMVDKKADTVTTLEPPTPEKEQPVNTVAPKLQPLTDHEKITVKTGKSAAAAEPDVPAEPAATKAADEPAATKEETPNEEVPAKEPAAEPAKTADDDTAPAADTAGDAADTSEASPARTAAAPAAEQNAAAPDPVESLIQDKTYFVPIGEHHSGGGNASSTVSVVILVLILLVVAAFVVVDAGIVEVPFELPFHVFPQ